VGAERLELGEAFLREAVYRSRARQAAEVLLAPPAAGGGGCGLGERAAVELDLSPRAEELYRALWPDGAGAGRIERVRACLERWVVEQDRIDRKRNHFLKAFRQRHGFDRDAYPAELAAEFEQGLARVNAEEDGQRRAAAQELSAL
jgi:hypothetical protein